MKRPIAKNAEAFWEFVDRSGGPNACWPWMGKLRKDSYGRARWKGRKTLVHRIAFELSAHRRPKLLVLHDCNNRPCCNPAHLYEGTQKQNVADSIRAGTFYFAGRRGELNGNAKLAQTQVEDIRRRMAEPPPVGGVYRKRGTVAALAKEFGVCAPYLRQLNKTGI